MGIEPDERHHYHGRQPERHTQAIEHKALQNHTDHIEAHRRPRHLRQEEEGGARAIGTEAKPLSEITVDSSEIEPVIEGQQQECHRHIAQDEAQAGLHISHIYLQHHAWHRNQRDTTDGGTHHAIGHHQPGRTSVAAIEGLVVGMSSCGEPAEKQEEAEIGCQSQQNHHTPIPPPSL